MFTPRDYQVTISDQAAQKIGRLGIVMLSIEVRCGKTFISLMTAQKAKAKNVLFVTKKKAMSSIQADYDTLSPAYQITIINYESLHKLEHNDFDFVIVDECHSLGAFPKPSQRTKNLKAIIGHKRLILMSGTITPESHSQIFHQFWISEYTPFPESNFYKWANTYVDVKKVYRSHGVQANDYSNAKMKEIKNVISQYMISFTQSQAGFSSKVEEEVLYVDMKPHTYELARVLQRDLVFEGKNGGVILAETPVKLLQKVHQIFSGTIKLEDGTAVILDTSKGDFIKEYFKGKKIGIFYKFREELTLLKKVFGPELLTENLQEFDLTNKNIALQVVSGREGISLKKADALVMFNIDHSATSYFQAKDRMTTKDRASNKVYWIFSRGGVEERIYRTVQDKKSYTTAHFKKDFNQPKQLENV